MALYILMLISISEFWPNNAIGHPLMASGGLFIAFFTRFASSQSSISLTENLVQNPETRSN